jgi:tRNA(Ile)-lysidine synthase
MADLRPASELVDRFRSDLLALTGDAPDRIGVAVSGGPDSLALLLLAATAFPGRIAAATVDHGLRAEAASEAGFVAGICHSLRLPHSILRPDWAQPPTANIQAEARAARYAALCAWAKAEDLSWIATGHHLDDQAETVLMRLARGAGVGGLSGIGATMSVDDRVKAVRPLLRWRRCELAEVAAAAGLGPVDDPSNDDLRFDRTRARRLLAEAPWIAPERIAASANHLHDAEQALAWSALRLQRERIGIDEDGQVTLNAVDLPIELQRRLLVTALRQFDLCSPIPGPKLLRFLDALRAGRPATLAGIRGRPGPVWRLERAPPRRTRT